MVSGEVNVRPHLNMNIITNDSSIRSSERDLPSVSSGQKKDRLLLEKLKSREEKIELDVIRKILKTPKGERQPED